MVCGALKKKKVATLVFDFPVKKAHVELKVNKVMVLIFTSVHGDFLINFAASTRRKDRFQMLVLAEEKYLTMKRPLKVPKDEELARSISVNKDTCVERSSNKRECIIGSVWEKIKYYVILRNRNLVHRAHIDISFVAKSRMPELPPDRHYLHNLRPIPSTGDVVVMEYEHHVHQGSDGSVDGEPAVDVSASEETPAEHNFNRVVEERPDMETIYSTHDVPEWQGKAVVESESENTTGETKETVNQQTSIGTSTSRGLTRSKSSPLSTTQSRSGSLTESASSTVYPPSPHSELEAESIATSSAPTTTTITESRMTTTSTGTPTVAELPQASGRNDAIASHGIALHSEAEAETPTAITPSELPSEVTLQGTGGGPAPPAVLVPQVVRSTDVEVVSGSARAETAVVAPNESVVHLKITEATTDNTTEGEVMQESTSVVTVNATPSQDMENVDEVGDEGDATATIDGEESAEGRIKLKSSADRLRERAKGDVEVALGRGLMPPIQPLPDFAPTHSAVESEGEGKEMETRNGVHHYARDAATEQEVNAMEVAPDRDEVREPQIIETPAEKQAAAEQFFVGTTRIVSEKEAEEGVGRRNGEV